MSATVIVLTVIGLIFIFVSFGLSERIADEKEESGEAVKIPKELTQEQKEKIDKLVRDYMDSQTDNRLADIETRLSEIVNQKTLALGDYAVSVNEEIERNHKEVVFLYDMLSDKQKEIMTTVSTVDEYKKEIAFIQKEITAEKIELENRVQESSNLPESAPKNMAEEETEAEVSQESDVPDSGEDDLDEMLREIEDTPIPEETREELENVDNKEMILEMHKAGLSILEIAKHLGLGVGEVKLVVDLFQTGDEKK